MKRVEQGLAWLAGSPPGANSCSAILGLGLALGLALGDRAFATDAAAATADSWLGRSSDEYAAEANLECPEDTALEITPSPYPRVECARADGTLHGPFMHWGHTGRYATRGSHEDGEIVGAATTRWFDKDTTIRKFYFHGVALSPIDDPNGICQQPSKLFFGRYCVHDWCDPPGCFEQHPEKGVTVNRFSFQLCELEGSDGPRIERYWTNRWGVNHGPSERFWTEDQLAQSSHYVEGELHGTVREWYRDGPAKSEGRFAEGKREGTHISWWPDGRVRWKAKFRGGVLKSVHGDTRILDRECPEGSLPFGSAPPHGRQIWCVDLSGRPAAEQPLPSATWYDETADPVLDRPDVFGIHTAMRGCGPLRIESADALGPPGKGVGR